MEELVVSDMAFIPCVDAGSSVMYLDEAWGSDPVGRSLGTGSSKSSCQGPLGRGILDDLLIEKYFEIVKLSCVASSECSSTRLYNFLGLCHSSFSPQWRMCRQIPHGNGWLHSNRFDK